MRYSLEVSANSLFLVPKFIKKLDEIPEIALPEMQSVKIALALSERGLVG
jgi:hypothetical protein